MRWVHILNFLTVALLLLNIRHGAPLWSIWLTIAFLAGSIVADLSF